MVLLYHAPCLRARALCPLPSFTDKQAFRPSPGHGAGSVTALCHIRMPKHVILTAVRTDPMHIADFIAIGFLIACLLLAAANYPAT